MRPLAAGRVPGRREQFGPAGAAGPSQGVGQRLFRALDHTGVELGVAPGVLGEVVAPHEALLAQRAAELLLARVRPVVARQLVRARELFKAVWPRAGEGPLTCEEGDRTRVRQRRRRARPPPPGRAPHGPAGEARGLVACPPPHPVPPAAPRNPGVAS